jgi:ribosomal protein L34E
VIDLSKKHLKRKFHKSGRQHGEKIKLVRQKTSKKTCAICPAQLSGVPHGLAKAGTRKLSKTQKRPSVPFGGVLCTGCRSLVAEETAKVLSGKKIEEVDLSMKPFVEKLLKRL